MSAAACSQLQLRFGGSRAAVWIVSWRWFNPVMQLSDELRAEILQHAKTETPKECCGLVAVVKGRHRYFPCQNIADTPDEHFVLGGWDEVEDQGEVVAIVPSHPKTSSHQQLIVLLAKSQSCRGLSSIKH